MNVNALVINAAKAGITLDTVPCVLEGFQLASLTALCADM